MVKIVDNLDSPTSTNSSSASSRASASASNSFTCEICGKQLATPQGLGGHKRLAHGVGISASANGGAESEKNSSNADSPGRDEEVEKLMRHVEGIGKYRLDRCKHNHGSLCHNWRWDEYPEGYGEYYRLERCVDDECSGKGRYHMPATPERCAICHSFEKRSK